MKAHKMKARVQQLRKQVYGQLIQEWGLSREEASKLAEGNLLMSGLENSIAQHPEALAKVNKTMQEILLIETLVGDF